MSDTRCPCKEFYFNQDSVSFNLNVVPLEIISSRSFILERPSLFIIPMVEDIAMLSTLYILPPVSNIISFNYQQFAFTIHNDILTASYNFYNGVTAPADAEYLSGSYGNYLAVNRSVMSTTEKQNRFDMSGSLIYDFFLQAGTLATQVEFTEATQKFIDQLPKMVDKRYFMPPGEYILRAGSESLSLIDGEFPGATCYMLVLELNSIS